MPATATVKAWLPPAKKARFAALAHAREMKESRLLGQLIDDFLANHRVTEDAQVARDAGPDDAQADDARAGDAQADDARVAQDAPAASVPRSDRITIRLRPGDGAQLRARAAARNLPESTYLAALVRAHLGHAGPVPQAELQAFKSAVHELIALSRQINPIAQSVNEGKRAGEGLRRDFGKDPRGDLGEGQQGGLGDDPTEDLARLREDLARLQRALAAQREALKAYVKANLIAWESGHAST